MFSWSRPDIGICNVYENVYLGSRDDSVDENQLRVHKIGTIISILDEEQRSPYEKRMYNRMRIRNHHFCMEDHPTSPIYTLFKRCNHIITHRSIPGRRTKPGVLVHCAAGISRSATILIAYGVIQFKWTVSEALEHVASKRNIIDPNQGFINQLVKVAKSLNLEETDCD